MAVARLCRVTLTCPRTELGVIVGRLMSFGEFHSSNREGMTQDIDLLLLGSRAYAAFSKANDLLASSTLESAAKRKPAIEKLEAPGLEHLVALLEGNLATIEGLLAYHMDDQTKGGLRNLLLAIREAGIVTFNNLQKLFVIPGLRETVTLEGYVPTKSLEEFKKLFGNRVTKSEPVERRQSTDPYVPSLLVNPRVVSSFESITVARGVPKYNEVDPTPIIALVFPFFFGIMFGDVGHGLVLLATGLILSRIQEYAYLGHLLLTFSVSATIVGFVRGAFFGVDFNSPLRSIIPLPQALSASFTLSYIPLLLEVAVIIGTFHLASAYVIAFINQVKSGNYAEAFLIHLPTIAFYSSIVPLGLAVVGAGLQVGSLFVSNASTPVIYQLLGLDVPVSVTARVSYPVVLASVIVLVIGHPVVKFRSTHELTKTAAALASGLLETAARPVEFMMNTVSYVRLGILLITASFLGSLVVGMLASGYVGVVVAVMLNVVVMGVEGLVVYIQDLRLHLYEWLSKFYAGTGIPFDPIALRGKLFEVNWV